jgi:TonB family protein
MYQIVENPHLKETVLKQEKVNRPSQDQKLVEEGLEKLQNVGLPSFAEKPLLKNELDKEVTKPTFHRESRLVKKVTLPPVTKEKFQNPVYNNYYAIIREKIREHAYRRYARNEEGEVYASFVVSSRGQIMDLKISDEMSQASAYLKNIALASIQDAAPFPAFPEQLKHPQLTFNVIISFELDN